MLAFPGRVAAATPSAANDAWDSVATRHIKTVLKRHNVTCADLAQRLTLMGVPETARSVTLKIDRGAYSAWWLFAVLRAVGVRVMMVD